MWHNITLIISISYFRNFAIDEKKLKSIKNAINLFENTKNDLTAYLDGNKQFFSLNLFKFLCFRMKFILLLLSG